MVLLLEHYFVEGTTMYKLLIATVGALAAFWGGLMPEGIGPHAASLADAEQEIVQESEFFTIPILRTAKAIVGRSHELVGEQLLWKDTAQSLKEDLRSTNKAWEEAVADMKDEELRHNHDGFRKTQMGLAQREYVACYEAIDDMQVALDGARELENVIVSYESGEKFKRVSGEFSSIARLAGDAAESLGGQVKAELAKFKLPSENQLVVND